MAGREEGQTENGIEAWPSFLCGRLHPIYKAQWPSPLPSLLPAIAVWLVMMSTDRRSGRGGCSLIGVLACGDDPPVAIWPHDDHCIGPKGGESSSQSPDRIRTLQQGLGVATAFVLHIRSQQRFTYAHNYSHKRPYTAIIHSALVHRLPRLHAPVNAHNSAHRYSLNSSHTCPQ